MARPSTVNANLARQMRIGGVGNVRAVLGIDAAWTLKQPSGVALVVERQGRWQLAATAPSYDHFLAHAAGDSPPGRPAGSKPDVEALLAAAATVAGVPVSVVAIDMPLSLSPITGRRAADNAVSAAYGARHCSTHTPSVIRPGQVSEDLRHGFELAGYPLCTTEVRAPGLMEVYPHPALVELAGAPHRLPYKASKVRKYWPTETPAGRRDLLLAQWTEIANLLSTELGGIAECLPALHAAPTGVDLKAHEDILDAIVCAWVGAVALAGGCDDFGDDTAAIWIPRASGPPWL